jgi:hypothetical protein
MYILAFLGFVKDKTVESDSQKFTRFGHGGLTIKLKEFTTTYINYKENEYANIYSFK